jgi:hypothetical protein
MAQYGRPHQRLRKALYPYIQWGVTPCYRCGHPLEAGDRVELDHADDESGYGGFSHGRSPCRICGKSCNRRAGGQKAALLAGRRLRERSCAICAMPYEATFPGQATCGKQACITALRRGRKDRQPDPEPPAQAGRTW